MSEPTVTSTQNLNAETAVSSVEFSMAVLCYRAEEEIIPFVENLHRIMSLFRFEWELVLVANYWPSIPDKTPAIVKTLAERLPGVRYLSEPKAGAMGWDMQRGLNACRGKYIGVIDGDGQFPVEAISSCFATIKSGNFDFIKTYRIARGDSFYRKFVSTIYNSFFRLLFPAYRGFKDVNSKPKIMKRDLYEKMDLRSTDWFIDAELVLNALALRAKLYEIPVNFMPLSKRQSFVKVGALTEFLRNLIAYRFGPRYLRHKT